MELIIMALIAFPLGFFVRNRLAAYVAYIAVHSFVFGFQNLTLTRAWVGGDFTAFDKDPTRMPWEYGLVNLVIYAVGFGLITLGYKIGAKRRDKSAAVELAR